MEKPKKNFTTFYRCEGNYNILNSKERSAQYVFCFRSDKHDDVKLQRSFLVDIEKDQNYKSDDEITALELAYWIKEVYESYWIHSEVSKIAEVISYLELIEEQEELARKAYEIEFAKYQIDYWNNRLCELTEVI